MLTEDLIKRNIADIPNNGPMVAASHLCNEKISEIIGLAVENGYDIDERHIMGIKDILSLFDALSIQYKEMLTIERMQYESIGKFKEAVQGKGKVYFVSSRDHCLIINNGCIYDPYTDDTLKKSLVGVWEIVNPKEVYQIDIATSQNFELQTIYCDVRRPGSTGQIRFKNFLALMAAKANVQSVKDLVGVKLDIDELMKATKKTDNSYTMADFRWDVFRGTFKLSGKKEPVSIPDVIELDELNQYFETDETDLNTITVSEIKEVKKPAKRGKAATATKNPERKKVDESKEADKPKETKAKKTPAKARSAKTAATKKPVAKRATVTKVTPQATDNASDKVVEDVTKH